MDYLVCAFVFLAGFLVGYAFKSSVERDMKAIADRVKEELGRAG